MADLTPNDALSERATLPECFGYLTVSQDTVLPVAPHCNPTPIPVDIINRMPAELALEARMFLDGA